MRAAELGFGGLNRKQIEIRNEREREYAFVPVNMKAVSNVIVRSLRF